MTRSNLIVTPCHEAIWADRILWVKPHPDRPETSSVVCYRYDEKQIGDLELHAPAFALVQAWKRALFASGHDVQIVPVSTAVPAGVPAVPAQARPSLVPELEEATV